MAIDLRSLTKSVIGDYKKDNILIENVSSKDVAIIGVACRFASSNNKNEYWSSLLNGKDHIREFPDNRQKINESYIKAKNIDLNNDGYFQGGFLQEVDKFDYEFFNISTLEASLMSPSQRIFLETALSAIEDAGYGGKKILGSKTGVFLGHSTDFGVSYKEYVETLNPPLASFAISGNLNSIIASRISYLLDLKGPSMTIDTACSSSLAAVHVACLSLRNRECSMALAGAVKIDLLPLNSIKGKEDEIGITSSDGRARTFDDSSKGTGLGEGVGALLLKPLAKALEDGDNIYAIIKGSSANQDGSSVNLTSPNPAAQEEVMIKAWQDAGIDPETITYIEAHGTGTELGDPIEINGIERAFKRYTNKKQFCAIGSVKTNIGHLDNAAGMAGLIKAILALKNKQIPQSIHFISPNRKINFENSPVYVNDILRDWEVDGIPRRCGVSAFGLSGTNCHVILEEAPFIEDHISQTSKNRMQVLTLSAKSREGILELIWQYQLFLSKSKNIELNNICYTANTGRGHYNCRLAVVFEHIRDLEIKLEKSVIQNLNGLENYGIFYGEHRIVSEKQKSRQTGEITQYQKDTYSAQINRKLNEYFVKSRDLSDEVLNELCEMYVEGADVEWDLLYQDTSNKKVSLPSYPFSRKSCWVQVNEESITKKLPNYKEVSHPLFERCLADSFDRITYLSNFDAANYWILNEHKVAGNFVVPGTTYLEMVSELINRHYNRWNYQLKDVVFLSSLSTNSEESVEVHTIINSDSENLEFTIASRSANSAEWKTHAEGKIFLLPNKNLKRLDVEKIKATSTGETIDHYDYESGKGIETSSRWDCIKETFVCSYGILAYLCLNKEYINELDMYNLHPALLDEAVNISLRSIGEGIYLPFSYKLINIYGPLTGKIYSLVKRRNSERSSLEFATFDITITDEIGNIIIEIEEYTIKKVDESKIATKNADSMAFSQIIWKERQNELLSQDNDDKNIIVLKGEGERNNSIVSGIKAVENKVVEVELGNEFKVISDDKFYSCTTEADYIKIFEHIKVNSIGKIIYLQTISNTREINTVEDLDEEQRKGVYGLTNLIKALVKSRLSEVIEIVIIAQYAGKVNKQQKIVIPENAALFGMGKSVNLEYPKIKCRCIDVDEYTQASIIAAEVKSEYQNYMTAYRDGQRFVPYIDLIDIDKIPDYKYEIKEQGVYVITGGTGCIGLEVAKFLSLKRNINIALINRTTFPSQEKWPEILEKCEDTKLCSKISILTDIIQMGSNIVFYNSDVSDIEDISKVLNDLRIKFGQLNGVFHIAGNAGDGFIINKDENALRNVLAPKINGTWILDRLTEKDKLDFFVMFSSISSISSEAGQADYASANSYLDAYSIYNNENGKRYITINWPAWSETGMAVDYNVDLTKEIFSPVSTKKALETLDVILNKNISNIIIGELIYNNFYSSKTSLFELSSKLTTMFATRKNRLSLAKVNYSSQIDSGVSRIELTGKEKKDLYTEAERKIANIMGEVLGVREVNIYDEFLDLGGNSIIAVKVEMEMEKYKIPITVPDLYEYKTVKDLAEFIDSKSDRVKFENNKSKDDNLNIYPKSEWQKGDTEGSLEFNNSLKIGIFKPFNDVFYKTCFHNSLFSVITHFNKNLGSILANDIFYYNFSENRELSQSGRVNIAEKSLFELINDLGITVKTQSHISYGKNSFTPPQEDINLLNLFSKYIGIKPSKSNRGIENLLDDIKSALQLGRPVIVWVDCFYESIRKDTYNKEHWMHSLLLYGFDETREVFFVIEHNFKENLTYKEREISYKDVVDAYEGFLVNYMNYTQMPTFYEFYLNEEINVDKQDAINSSDLYRQNLEKHKSSILNGLDNLKAMIEKINMIFSSEQNLKNNIDELITLLNNIINARQIDEYNISVLFGNSNNLVEDIKNIIYRWTYVRKVAFKYKFSAVFDEKEITSIAQKLDEIYKFELMHLETIGL